MTHLAMNAVDKLPACGVILSLEPAGSKVVIPTSPFDVCALEIDCIECASIWLMRAQGG